MSIKIESTLMLLIFLFFQQSVRLYDVQNNNMRLKYNHANAVLDCCFQDGVHSYSGGLDSTLKVWVDFICTSHQMRENPAPTFWLHFPAKNAKT